jgi:hypothetical protein
VTVEEFSSQAAPAASRKALQPRLLVAGALYLGPARRACLRDGGRSGKRGRKQGREREQLRRTAHLGPSFTPQNMLLAKPNPTRGVHREAAERPQVAAEVLPAVLYDAPLHGAVMTGPHYSRRPIDLRGGIAIGSLRPVAWPRGHDVPGPR